MYDTSTEFHLDVVADVMDALESNRLELPTLPDIAFKIRKALDDPNISADNLVSLLSFDPIVSAQIIKAANSAALSNGRAVDSLRPAIARLGYRALHNLVIAVTLTKLFQADSVHVNRRLKKLWEHSRQVAANSYVLASRYQHLRSEEAMLAGLVHDIGALPLYIYADRYYRNLSEDALDELILKFGGAVGEKLLRHWNFSDELIEVVRGHENLHRGGDADQIGYADIVTIANLQIPGVAEGVDWNSFAVIHKLGLSVEECQNFLSRHQAELAKVQSMYWIGAPKSRPEVFGDVGVERAGSVAQNEIRNNSGWWARILSFFH